MPRYYFHIRDGHGVKKDSEGVELPDLDAARTMALEAACKLWSSNPPDPSDNDQTFEISDEAGQTVLTVSFSEAFAERAVT